MVIKEYTEFKADEILQLYTQVGWTAYTEDMPALERGYKNSLLILAAYENGELRFWGWFARWATDIPLYLCRIFWCTRQDKDRASALRCLRRCWNDIRMFDRSNW